MSGPYVFHEWTVFDEDDNELVLTITTTEEGVILDVFDEDGEESLYTEAMTANEWLDWMIERDQERIR